jgi:hypothetical protein
VCVRSKIKKKIKKHIRYCVKLNINIYIYKPNWPKPNNSQPNKTQLEPNKTLTLTPIKSINQYPTNQTSTHTLSLKLYFFFFIPMHTSQNEKNEIEKKKEKKLKLVWATLLVVHKKKELGERTQLFSLRALCLFSTKTILFC